MRAKVFRPHLDDVERLSHGKGATKQRGTGSKYVCHRLNRDERRFYEHAKQALFLTVKGTGYRKERKGSPLQNIWRQRCDALAIVYVCIEKRSSEDTVVIDLSTLRTRDDATLVNMIMDLLKSKYPDLYKLVVDSGETGTSSSLLQTPIDWNAVKTKPIWAVKERLITIPCEHRDVAKSLAENVMEESSQFILADFQHDRIDLEDIAMPSNNEIEEADDLTERKIDDDDGIDWDDI